MKSSPWEIESGRRQIRSILNRCTPKLENAAHLGVFDSDGHLMDAVGPHVLHYPSLELTIKAVKSFLPMQGGDTWVTNDPFIGNSSVGELLFFRAIMARDRSIRFYVAVQLQLSSLFRKPQKGFPQTMEEEGMRVPPSPVDRKIENNEALLSYLASNPTSRAEAEQALKVAVQTLDDLGASFMDLEKQWGIEKFSQIQKDLNEYSESCMKKALSLFPDGDYSATDHLDSDGKGIQALPLTVKLSIHGENFSIGFSGTHRQTQGSMNTTYATNLGVCFAYLSQFVEEEIPINSGALRSFSVEAPVGSLVNAQPPASTIGGYFETSLRIWDTLNLAASRARPKEIPASFGGTHATAILWFGDRTLILKTPSGEGGSPHKSGRSAVFSPVFGNKVTSVEYLECTYPVQVIQSALREGSGAKGQFSGGEGMTVAYKLLEPCHLMIFNERVVHKPQGLFGGVSASHLEVVINSDSLKKKNFAEKQVLDLNAGDALIINTPGGGSWGKVQEVPEEEES